MSKNLLIVQVLAVAVMLSLAAHTTALPVTKTFPAAPKVVASASVKLNKAPLINISVNKKEAGPAAGKCCQ
jgi:hypothetical protein